MCIHPVFSPRNPNTSPTKLICFTRSSPLIYKLPNQYPSSIIDEPVTSVTQQTLSDLVFSDPSQLVVRKISSFLSQSSMQDMLKDFVLSDKAQVSF